MLNKRLSHIRSTLPFPSQRKGTHVGIIISFIIFMTFIFFILIIIAPRVKNDDRNDFLEYVAQNIAENASGNLTGVSISVPSGTSGNCLRMSGFFTATGAGDNFLVKNDGETTLQSSKDGSDLLIVRQNSETFFKFLQSAEFSPGATGTLGSCTQLTEGSGYFLGLMKTEKIIFETRIESLISSYESEYETTKDNMKIPDGEDFSFNLGYENGTILSPEEINETAIQGVSIYSDNFPIIYVEKNANINAGFLGVRLWG